MVKNGGLGRLDLFYFFAYLAIFLVLFWPFFFKSETFYERDSTLLETPVRMHAVQLLKEGNFALWTDSHGNGQPFMANPKMAIFYPTTWLYLVFPFFIAFKIHYFIHPVLGWLGMYLLAKTYGLSRKSAFLSSSLFFLSGMYLSSFEFYNHIAAMAWMMWALYLQRLDWPLKSLKFLFNIMAWVFLILAGAPEFIIITLLLSIVQAMIFGTNLGGLKKYLTKLSVIVFMSILISCLQLIPSFQLLLKSGRSSQAELWPLELVQLTNLVFPGILGDDRQPGNDNFWGGHLFNTWYPLYYSLYVGFGFLILAAFSGMDYKRRREGILFLSAFIFFLIACGKYSPFFFIYNKMPFLSSIRFPVKYFMGTIFCLALLAGMGFDRLAEGRPGRRFGWGLLLTGLLAGILTVLNKAAMISALSKLFVIGDNKYTGLLMTSVYTGLAMILIYGVLFVFLAENIGNKKLWLMLLLIICLTDVAYHNRFINPVVDQSFFAPPKILKELGPSPVIYRDSYVPFIKGIDKIDRLTIFNYYRQTLNPFIGLPFGVRYVLNDDFMATYARTERELIKRIKGLEIGDKVKVLRYVGCQYYLGEKPLLPESGHKHYAVTERLGISIQKISEQQPGPYLAYKIVLSRKTDDKLTEFLNPGFDPFDKVLVDDGVEVPGIVSVGRDESMDRPEEGDLTVVEKKHGYGRFRTNSTRIAILVVPGNYSKGWKAWIDGKRTRVFSANIFSKGIVVPAGAHEVVMKYWPTSFWVGSLISVDSLMVIISVWVNFSRKAKKGEAIL